jgi:hypothetical protein
VKFIKGCGKVSTEIRQHSSKSKQNTGKYMKTQENEKYEKPIFNSILAQHYSKLIFVIMLTKLQNILFS